MNEHIESTEAGARNLLLNCAEVKTGDRILLIGEECDSPYFDPRLCNDIAQVAEKLGVKSEIVMAKPVADASQFPSSISDAMLTVDKTIFFPVSVIRCASSKQQAIVRRSCVIP